MRRVVPIHRVARVTVLPALSILMAWPPSGQMLVTSLPAGAPTGKPTAVSLLGSESKLEFSQDAEGLKVQTRRTERQESGAEKNERSRKKKTRT